MKKGRMRGELLSALTGPHRQLLGEYCGTGAALTNVSAGEVALVTNGRMNKR